MIWIKLFWVRKLFFWVCIDGPSVWGEFGENGIENDFENGILRAKNAEVRK